MLRRIKRLFGFQAIYDGGERARRLGVTIGKDCEIYDDVSFGSEPYLVKLGDHVRLTRGIKLITHNGAVWVIRNKYDLQDIDLFKPINIGNNVHIGMNSIIMPGVSIGDHVIIGCGAIVTKSVPSGEIWEGYPQKN